MSASRYERMLSVIATARAAAIVLAVRPQSPGGGAPTAPAALVGNQWRRGP